MARLGVLLFIALQGTARAGGLHHAEEWVFWRDGGWIFNFLILFAGLYWIVRRLVIPALDKRRELIAKELEYAEKARTQAMKKLAELENKTRMFEEEAVRIREETISEGEKIKEQIISEAAVIADRIVGKAKEEIEMETQMAKNRLRSETVELSMKLALKLLEENMGQADHKIAVGKYLARVGNMS